MNLSGDARTLWDAAMGLDRARAAVSTATISARPLPPMLFLTDPERTPEPWRTARSLPGGAAVVYRAFGAEDAEHVGRRLREITARRGLILLVGLDADLAERIGADGLHLPEHALSSAVTLRARYPDWLMTGAVHSLDAVSTADSDALDALVLSPVFPAGGPSSRKAALGEKTLGDIVRSSRLPVYALGGVGVETVGRLAGSGACGFAAVEAIARAFVA